MAPVLLPTAGGRHSLPPSADLPPPTAQLKYGQPSIHDYVSLGTHPPSRSLDIESKPGSPPQGTPGGPSSTNSSLFPFHISLFSHPQALREAGPHSHRGSTRPVPVCSTPGTGPPIPPWTAAAGPAETPTPLHTLSDPSHNLWDPGLTPNFAAKEAEAQRSQGHNHMRWLAARTLPGPGTPDPMLPLLSTAVNSPERKPGSLIQPPPCSRHT